MSALTTFRDHCRKMADAPVEYPRPKGISGACHPPLMLDIDEDHGGCPWGWQTCDCTCHDDERPQPPTAAERALWTRLADEIDAYLAGALVLELPADEHTTPLWDEAL